MSEAPFDLKQAHRWFAIELNNQAWDLVEHGDRRSGMDDQVMLHAAHAACYHWLQVGQPVNHQRALCLLANVIRSFVARQRRWTMRRAARR